MLIVTSVFILCICASSISKRNRGDQNRVNICINSDEGRVKKAGQVDQKPINQFHKN